ncbi:MAG TPA: hypothetical protein VFM02_02450 [Candidatus Paceibacterota bacterium]|nr:hypothetical protein [Candidatus Paceibacterota bacterium]
MSASNSALKIEPEAFRRNLVDPFEECLLLIEQIRRLRIEEIWCPEVSTTRKITSRKTQCTKLYNANKKTIASLKRQIKSDKNSSTHVVLVVQVYDPNGSVLAEIFRPGFPWQVIRSFAGHEPVLRMIVPKNFLEIELEHIPGFNKKVAKMIIAGLKTKKPRRIQKSKNSEKPRRLPVSTISVVVVCAGIAQVF